jgi:hypothetical protein
MESQLSIGQGVGLGVVLLVLGVFLINAVIMLVSPGRWFSLPKWMAFRGVWHARDRPDTINGRLRIRALGLIFTGGIGWMIWNLMSTLLHPMLTK